MGDNFAEMISDKPTNIQELAQGAKALLHQVMPDVVEVVWLRQRIAGYGIGPKKMSEQFCYIAPFKKHVNLGFYYGADLTDPTNLLAGTGKNLRHVKLTRPDQLQDPALHALVTAASTHLPNLKRN